MLLKTETTSVALNNVERVKKKQKQKQKTIKFGLSLQKAMSSVWRRDQQLHESGMFLWRQGFKEEEGLKQHKEGMEQK